MYEKQKLANLGKEELISIILICQAQIEVLRFKLAYKYCELDPAKKQLAERIERALVLLEKDNERI